MTLTGKPIAPLEPGSPEWLRTISASKVPAILRISPWQSRYTLWHQMAGNIPTSAGSKATERGTFLETAVLAWFKAQHKGELDVDRGRSYANIDHPDWSAAPDGIAADMAADEPSWNMGIEVKTSQYADGWGVEGTAEVPPYYLAQVAWQMIVTGFRRVYVPVLFGSPFEFREYVVDWADVEADVPAIIAEVIAFQVSLADGKEPALDGDNSTYETIRQLHPEIDGTEIALPDDLAHAYLIQKQVLDSAERVLGQAKNRIADYMGSAKKATWNGATIFTRQAKGEGRPFLVQGRALPTITEQEQQAA